jgi:hypothetical protein
MIEAAASAAVAQPMGVLSDAQDPHARGPYLVPDPAD